jgi:hypothetical protein
MTDLIGGSGAATWVPVRARGAPGMTDLIGGSGAATWVPVRAGGAPGMTDLIHPGKAYQFTVIPESPKGLSGTHFSARPSLLALQRI